MDTSLKRTVALVPRVSALERVDCSCKIVTTVDRNSNIISQTGNVAGKFFPNLIPDNNVQTNLLVEVHGSNHTLPEKCKHVPFDCQIQNCFVIFQNQWSSNEVRPLTAGAQNQRPRQLDSRTQPRDSTAVWISLRLEKDCLVEFRDKCLVCQDWKRFL